MAIAILVVTGLVIFVVAIVTIGRVVGRLSVAPPTSVFDEDEAVEWIADRLPFEVTAQLSHDDVRQIVVWHLDYLEHEGIATEAAYADAPDNVVVGEDDALAYVLGKATEAGMEASDTQVALVLDTERAYLEAIGAIGPQVRDR
jgi:hypothetical protein